MTGLTILGQAGDNGLVQVAGRRVVAIAKASRLARTVQFPGAGGQSLVTQPLPGMNSRLPEEDLQPAVITIRARSTTIQIFDMSAI